MKLLFAKSRWEIEMLPTSEYIVRSARDGFDLLEINALTLADDEIPGFAREAKAAGLPCIVQGLTLSATPEGQMAELERQVERSMALEPLSFNFHLGRDYFSPEENQRIHEHAIATAARHGVLLHTETHRSRACHSLPSTVEMLRRVPARPSPGTSPTSPASTRARWPTNRKMSPPVSRLSVTSMPVSASTRGRRSPIR
jgi:hypothetical protein